MKEFYFEIYDSDGLEDTLSEVRRYIETVQASSIIAHLYTGYTDRVRVASVLDVLEQLIPTIEIVGSTAGGEICNGAMSPLCMVLVITVFTSTHIQVKHYSVVPGQEEQTGSLIQELIDTIEDIKAAELLVDCGDISTAQLFPNINRCSSKVKIFGAVPYAHETGKPNFVFCKGHIREVSVVVVCYSGKDFHINTDYIIGWKPMGVGMCVTKANGNILNELDHQSALAVYDKYLQIPNDEHFFENAFEFPFLRYINDTYMMCLPYHGLEDGSIELRAPVNEGETLYLSYGDVPTILLEISEARNRMERFHPQYIRLHNCATRKAFWGDRINQELAPFQEVANTSGFFTGGEILRVNGELVHFNATLVIVGMREGAPDSRELLRMSELNKGKVVGLQQASMVRRMAHFINVAMQELLESNKQLDMLAKTDELTGLLNRRELNRIIKELHSSGQSFCLLMADLDDFKKVNDTYGHDIGDLVLQDVANLIRSSIKHLDDAAAGRWGGEEFMVLLPSVSMEQAEQTAEHLREAIANFSFPEIKNLTISLGVADSQTYDDMRLIYHDVDQALYAAKKAGKNMVVLVSHLGPDETDDNS